MTAVQQTQEKIRSLQLEILLHPPYSADLALKDLDLFWSLKHFIKYNRFRNKEEIENGLSNIFFRENSKFL